MAVLFPTPQGHFLRPDRPAELLQGFLNIQNLEGVNNGQLTQANLASYGQKRFFAPDPSSNVAGYLTQNFAQIAAIDGNALSISTDDLVQLRQGLPPVQTTPPPTQQPPTQQPPLGGNPNPIFGAFLGLMQMMMQMILSMFR